MLVNERGKIKVIALIVLVVVVVAIAGVFLISKKASSHKGERKEVKIEKTEMIPLDEFLVNLADSNESHYLKAELAIEVSGEKTEEELVSLKPKIRDTIIQVLSSKCYADVLGADGKEAVKVQIKKSLNEGLHELKVTDVFFNSFAMQ